MADTTNYHWTKPVVGASSDAWGTTLNQALDDIDTDLFAVAAVPTGLIALWSGSSGSIPTGWHLCDGTSGTPNLRDRFIVGAGSAYAVGDTGGSTSQTITVAGHALSATEMPAHSHALNDPQHSHSIVGMVDNDATPPSGYVFTATGGGLEIINNGSVGASGTGITMDSAGGGAAHSHTATGTDNRPPYYALCFIMKL